jgi:AraC family transcriptional regulator, regulatory protein of adaptative response / methylated-DNA-[protein]-cysteine methyltransferase
MTTQNLDTIEPETLRLRYGDTALGTIVVAESMRGIVALFIGDDRAKLLRDLKGTFPEAELVWTKPAWHRPSPRPLPWSTPRASGPIWRSICAARPWR